MPRAGVSSTTSLGATPWWEIPENFFKPGPPEYGWDRQYQGTGTEILVIAAQTLARDLRSAGFYMGPIGQRWTSEMEAAFRRWVAATGVEVRLEVPGDGRNVTLTPRSAIDVLRGNIRYGGQPYATVLRPGEFHVQRGVAGLGAEAGAVTWAGVSPWVWVAGAATLAIFGAVLFMRGR